MTCYNGFVCYGGIATRYDKTSSSYASFVAAAAALVALTGWPG